MYLADLDSDAFVSEYYNAQSGEATAAGTVYPSSYWYEFSNCGNCTEDTVVIIPSGTKGLLSIQLTR